MVRRTEEGQNEEALDADIDAAKVGWQETIQDMRAMAADREEKGYETLTAPSHNTALVAPADGDEDDERWGLSHLLDSEDSEAFADFYAGLDPSETGVYQFEDSGNVFMVTEHVDYDDERIVFLACAFRMADAPATVRAAMDRGTLHTYVRDGHGTILGTFEHDDPEAFFPDPEVYYAFGPDI